MAKKNIEPSINWVEAFKPLFKKYQEKRHPLTHDTTYQLLVKVVLSARDSDRHINAISPALFERYPSMKILAKATPEDLYPLIDEVMNFANKAAWLSGIAKALQDDKNIPITMESLTALKGIGRKSANVIMSESGAEMEGIIVDLHVLRVAPRIGIAKGTNPEKIEKQLMDAVPQKYWRPLGMGLTFLGREICRPTNPHCPECPMNEVCEYYNDKLKK